MKLSIRSSRELARDERGLTTVEYTIVLCLIAALAVGSWKVFGSKVTGYLQSATSDIDKQLHK